MFACIAAVPCGCRLGVQGGWGAECPPTHPLLSRAAGTGWQLLAGSREGAGAQSWLCHSSCCRESRGGPGQREQHHPGFTVLGKTGLFIALCRISQVKFSSVSSLRYFHEWKRGSCPLSNTLESHSPSCCTKFKGICSAKGSLRLLLPIISGKETKFVPKRWLIAAVSAKDTWLGVKHSAQKHFRML